jgi:hypothetical protein
MLPEEFSKAASELKKATKDSSPDVVAHFSSYDQFADVWCGLNESIIREIIMDLTDPKTDDGYDDILDRAHQACALFTDKDSLEEVRKLRAITTHFEKAYTQLVEKRDLSAIPRLQGRAKELVEIIKKLINLKLIHKDFPINISSGNIYLGPLKHTPLHLIEYRNKAITLRTGDGRTHDKFYLIPRTGKSVVSVGDEFDLVTGESTGGDKKIKLTAHSIDGYVYISPSIGSVTNWKMQSATKKAADSLQQSDVVFITCGEGSICIEKGNWYAVISDSKKTPLLIENTSDSTLNDKLQVILSDINRSTETIKRYLEDKAGVLPTALLKSPTTSATPSVPFMDASGRSLAERASPSSVDERTLAGAGDYGRRYSDNSVRYCSDDARSDAEYA